MEQTYDRVEVIPVTATHEASRSDAGAWALAASAATEGLWVWDLRRRTLQVSPRAEEMLGFGNGRRGRTAREMLRHVDAADAPLIRRAIRALLTGRCTRIDVEFRVLTKGGDRRWMLLRARSRSGSDGRVSTIGGVLADIDARRRTEEQLRHESRHDPLTGLPNRVALMDQLCARIARAAAHPGDRFAVAYIDMDDFKVVNDTLGHAAGDAVLAATASRIEACLGRDDVLARMSGDEFVAIIEDAASAGQAASALHAAMARPIMVSGRKVFSALSVGLRMVADERCKPTDIIRDADLAMYEAKRMRGNRTAVFDRAMHAAMLRRFTMQHELQGALHAGEFRLAYHPVFDTAEDRLCGFEALLRWDHPQRGPLRAEAFIEDANESGLIVPIGRWVMREACTHVAEWTQAYPHSAMISVAVNLCDRELLDGDFPEFVQRTLEETGVAPGQLCLEMTEGALGSRLDAVAPGLEQLRALGVQIQLDNFGAGRTSIGMLRRLPLTAVKIDRHVIRDVASCEETKALVATILTYAHRLGLAVVAEGVESDDQVETLASLGPCRYVQGPLAGQRAEVVAGD